MYYCIRLVFAALAVIPAQADDHREPSSPVVISEIESKTSAKYIGHGEAEETVDIQPRYVEPLGGLQCDREYSCLNCTAARVCAPQTDGRFVEISRVRCPQDKPTCDAKSGACVSNGVLECLRPSNIRCFKKTGYFPHPTNCKKFIYCSNYLSYVFVCTKSYTYDLRSQQCNTATPCYAINCAGHEGRKVGFPFSDTYFSYCSGGVPIGIDRCEQGDTLNVYSQLCEDACTIRGFEKDDKDCTKYFRCDYEVVDGKKVRVRKHDKCPEGSSFKEYLSLCLPGIPAVGCVQE